MNKPLDQIELEEEILNTRSQMEIATIIMTRKKYVYNNDVVVVIGNHVFNTINCQDEYDFLKKYHEELSEIGIKKFSISYDDSRKYYTVNIDSTNTNHLIEGEDNEENLGKSFSITTEGCTSIMDFKIKNQEVFNEILPEVTNQILQEMEKKFVDVEGLRAELDDLLKEEASLKKMLLILNKMKLGEIDYDSNQKFYTTPSFEKREKELNEKISSLLFDKDMPYDARKSAIDELKKEFNRLSKKRNFVILKLEEANERLLKNQKRRKKVEELLDKATAKVDASMNSEVPTESDKADLNSNDEIPDPKKDLPEIRMSAKNNLEEDYYKRLENAANEKPIFTDNEADFDIPSVDKKPHIIKKISKAPLKLISKIKKPNFKQLISRGLQFLKRHKLAAVALLTVIAMPKIPQNFNSELLNENNNTTATDTTLAERVPIHVEMNKEGNNNIIPEEVINAINEKSEEEQFNTELEETLNNILDGKTKVYVSSDRAINDVGGKLPTERQLENSWENATPGAYYTLENNNLQKITREEATDYWQDGGTVAVRMDNNGTPIGWVPVEGQENTTSKGK